MILGLEVRPLSFLQNWNENKMFFENSLSIFFSQNFLSVSVHCRAEEMWWGWSAEDFFYYALKAFLSFSFEVSASYLVFVLTFYMEKKKKAPWFILVGNILNIWEGKEQEWNLPD